MIPFAFDLPLSFFSAFSQSLCFRFGNLLTDDVDAFKSMVVGMQNLITIDKARCKEVDNHLQPQCLIFCCYVRKRCSHRIHTNKGTYSECRREEHCHCLPCSGHVALRPWHARKEEKWHRYEHNKQKNVLTIADNTRKHHAKKDGSKDEWYHNGKQCLPMKNLNITKQSRNNKR